MTDIGHVPGTTQPSLRVRQRAEREQLILSEAEQLLAEQGYDGLIMDVLAERVGISKGTIYQHFATKEDLFGAILLRGLEYIDTRITAQLADSEQSTVTRLETILISLIDSQSTWMSAVTGPQKHELAGTLSHHPGLRDAVGRSFDKLIALIQQGQDRGELDAAVPAAVAARFMFSLVRSRGRFDLPTGVSNADFAAYAVRFYFHGMSAPLTR